MSFSITVPPSYGYVILSCTFAPFVTNFIMSGPVMKAREQYKVPYPNLYATPGYHKDADAFNRIQRGHQNMFESLATFTVSAMVGGLKYPIFCSVCGALFCLGNILYQKGYGDTSLDVKMARYKKGGIIKILGYFGVVGASVSMAGSVIGWW